MTQAMPQPIANIAFLPANETARLEALQRYKILDTPPEKAFDRITSLAARIFDVPTVLVALVDESRAWFKSCYGFEQREIAREASLCNFALVYNDVFVIPDARLDDRFACNPFVQGDPGLRFYAGAPLLTQDGFNLGTLCLVDTKPRHTFTDEEKATLADLAAMVIEGLELRLAAGKIAQIDAAILEVTQGVSGVTGKAFFFALAQNISKTLGVNYACISLLINENPEMVKTIAFCTQGEIVENVEYELEGTPCLEVIRQQKIGCYPRNLQTLFPNDLFLVSLGIESYASIPFFDSRGKLLGLLTVMDNQPLENVPLVESLLTLFAMRIAVELERQQAEDLQQEATRGLQLYADVVRNAQVGIVVWQLEDASDPGSFRLVIANPAASEATGFDFEPVIGKTMAESFPKLLQTPLAQQYLEVVNSGRSLDIGEITYSGDGISQGFYSLKAFPLPDNCLGLAFENITTRKQTEIQLQESQHYNQQITEALPGILFVYDIIQQQNVYTNCQITDLLGYTSEQIQAMGTNVISTLIHPDDLQPVLTYFETFHTASDDEVSGIEYRAHHFNGEWRWLYAQSVVFKRTTDGLPQQILGVSIDITDRKQSEAILAEQEQRYRYIFEAVNVAIWEEDFSEAKAALDQLKGSGIQNFRQYFAEHPQFVEQMVASVRIYNVNQTALQMFGAREKTELLSSLKQIFVPETHAAFIGELLAIAEGETFFAAETVVRTLQGDRLNVWFSITFPPASETYDRVLVSLLDITQRKQAEAALQASEERYRYLAEATPQIVWTTDANGMATYFNPNWYEYTGMSEAESLGLGSTKALHPDDRDRVLQQWLIAIERGQSYEMEIRLRRRDGVYHWFLCRGLPVRNASDRIVSWVGTNTDIDNQKHIEEALRQSQERLSLALRSAQAGMWQWFKVDNATIWSDENFRLLGYQPGECPSTYESWLQAVHPDDREMVQQAVQQTLEENSSLYFEYRACLPDGSVRWLADIGQITYDEQGNQDGMIGIQIDISKRKQSELERERSEAVLNAFLTASPIALTLFDQDLRFIYANEALAQINGLPLWQHLGRTLWDVLPDMASQFAPMLQQIIKTQEPVLNLEFSGNVQPGVYRHTIANHFPVCLPSGEVLGVGVTVTDISPLKRVEAELRQSEERLSLALQAANQGLYDLNMQTGDMVVSPQYARMLGYEPEEFQETNAKWRNRLHPDDVEMVYRIYQEYIAGMHNEFRVEFRQGTKTGRWIWILSVGKIVAWDKEDNPIRMLGTHTDISDRKQAEQVLQQHTERLNLLYETTSDLLSAERPLDLMNRLFNRLSKLMDLHYYYQFKLVDKSEKSYLVLMNYSGISEEQAKLFETIEIGQAVCGLVAQQRRQIVLNQAEIKSHLNAQAICLMGITAYSGQPLMVHGRLLGTLSFASLTRTQFTPEEVNLLQAISEQVAIALDRAELVASLQQQTEDLAQANRVKDEFLAVLSHELRSPLNPILGWTKLLQTGKFDAQKTKQALEVIERNAKQQTQLIDDLLDISKILRGKLILRESPVNLALTIEAALETVRLAAEAKNIQIETEFDSVLPPVLGDGGRLQQIVLNLLSNAIKFTPNGGQVEVYLKKVNSEAQIQVKDNGKGITPDFLPYVFESFRQEDGKITRKFGGLGLGLAIVRQLTELHGGTVSVQSMGEGTGATFTVCLPLMKTFSLGVNDTPSVDDSFGEANPLQGIKILVVDDEADMQDLMVMILEQAGAIAKTATSAAEALTVFTQFQPMLLISDIGMPNMDGYMLMQQVRALPPEQGGQTPAIALTAYAGEYDRRRAIEVGFQKHLPKPIEPETLVNAISELI
ncbi:PAS domain-containing protein [Aerosakkonemataceae cyanobacterium BLCC-F50]|uniref:histidine kinase n=1 Tax=Floridaenema flaviceps BLCC-F50 TaxID=3153642 RepID=A0ABV4XN61_9CYAN